MAAPTLTPTTATVHAITEARRARTVPADPAPHQALAEYERAERRARALPCPDAIQAEHQSVLRRLAEAQRAAGREFEAKFAPAVRQVLQADLETWPKAFQRRLDGFPGPWPGTRGLDGDTARYWERWKRARENGTDHMLTEERGCVCGCRGFNDDLATQVRILSEAARDLSATRGRKAFLRARRREKMDEAKHDLLELLWQHGVRRIDRQSQREHLAEALQTELTRSRESIKHAKSRARYARERLENGVTEGPNGKNDPRGGKPLSASAIAGFERDVRDAMDTKRSSQALLAELEVLGHNPAELVRQWTGCARSQRLVFGGNHAISGPRLEGLAPVAGA